MLLLLLSLVMCWNRWSHSHVFSLGLLKGIKFWKPHIFNWLKLHVQSSTRSRLYAAYCWLSPTKSRQHHGINGRLQQAAGKILSPFWWRSTSSCLPSAQSLYYILTAVPQSCRTSPAEDWFLSIWVWGERKDLCFPIMRPVSCILLSQTGFLKKF